MNSVEAFSKGGSRYLNNFGRSQDLARRLASKILAGRGRNWCPARGTSARASHPPRQARRGVGEESSSRRCGQLPLWRRCHQWEARRVASPNPARPGPSRRVSRSWPTPRHMWPSLPGLPRDSETTSQLSALAHGPGAGPEAPRGDGRTGRTVDGRSTQRRGCGPSLRLICCVDLPTVDLSQGPGGPLPRDALKPPWRPGA